MNDWIVEQWIASYGWVKAYFTGHTKEDALRRCLQLPGRARIRRGTRPTGPGAP